MNDNQIEQLAQMITTRLARTTLVPIMTLQLLLLACVTCSWSDRVHAQDDTAAQARVTLTLPDDIEPPKPDGATVIVNDRPDAERESAVSKDASKEVSKDASKAAETVAEVVTSEEVAATAAITSPSSAAAVTADEPAPIRELSVPPQSQPLLPADRPAWVGGQPDLSGKDHRLFVGSFPTATSEEADAALDEPMVEALASYLNEYVLPYGHAYKLPAIDAHFIRTNLLESSPTYMAELSTQVGAMYQKWVVLKITPEQREHLIHQYSQVVQRERAIGLGAGLLGILALVGGANLAFSRRRRRHQLEPLSAMFVRGPAHGPAHGSAQNPMVQDRQPLDVAPNRAQAGREPVQSRLVSLPVLENKSNKKKKQCCSRGSAFVPIAIVMLVLGINAYRKKMDARREAHAAPPTVVVEESTIETPVIEKPVIEKPIVKEHAQPWHQEAKVHVEHAFEQAKKAIVSVGAKIEQAKLEKARMEKAKLEQAKSEQAKSEQSAKSYRTRISVGHGDNFLEITHDSVNEDSDSVKDNKK